MILNNGQEQKISVKCPECGETLTVRVQYTEQGAACPICGRVFNVSEENKKQLERLERNARRREINQFLRDVTGTSARAAREDMGL